MGDRIFPASQGCRLRTACNTPRSRNERRKASLTAVRRTRLHVPRRRTTPPVVEGCRQNFHPEVSGDLLGSAPREFCAPFQQLTALTLRVGSFLFRDA